MKNLIHSYFPCSAHWLAAVKRLCTSALLLALLQATAHAGPAVLQGRIVRVIDGDTVTLQDERQTLHKIRLAGIDAPESAMPHGQIATLHLTALVLNKNVEAVTHKQDRYGRTIATLMLGAQDVNLFMIQAGLAWHYKRYANEQPVDEAAAYAQAEEVARIKKLALWQDSDPGAPWDWRQSRRVRLQQSVGAIMPGELAMNAGTLP